MRAAPRRYKVLTLAPSLVVCPVPRGGSLRSWSQGHEITRDELPDCWALHGPAVIELLWLRSAHVQAYIPGAAPHVAGKWHPRWRPGVITRLPVMIDACVGPTNTLCHKASLAAGYRCRPDLGIGSSRPASSWPKAATGRRSTGLPSRSSCSSPPR